MRKPIACSLEVTDARSQIDEWRAALVPLVTAIDRVDESVRLRLRSGADYAPLIELARREVACCPFFRFGLEIDSEGVEFTIWAPAEAATILDGFADLARAAG